VRSPFSTASKKNIYQEPQGFFVDANKKKPTQRQKNTKKKKLEGNSLYLKSNGEQHPLNNETFPNIILLHLINYKQKTFVFDTSR